MFIDWESQEDDSFKASLRQNKGKQSDWVGQWAHQSGKFANGLFTDSLLEWR